MLLTSGRAGQLPEHPTTQLLDYPTSPVFTPHPPLGSLCSTASWTHSGVCPLTSVFVIRADSWHSFETFARFMNTAWTPSLSSPPSSTPFSLFLSFSTLCLTHALSRLDSTLWLRAALRSGLCPLNRNHRRQQQRQRQQLWWQLCWRATLAHVNH